MKAFDEEKAGPYTVKELMFYLKQHDQKAHVRLGLLLMEGIASPEGKDDTLATLLNKLFVHARDNVNFKNPEKAKAYWYDVTARLQRDRIRDYQTSRYAAERRRIRAENAKKYRNQRKK